MVWIKVKINEKYHFMMRDVFVMKANEKRRGEKLKKDGVILHGY